MKTFKPYAAMFIIVLVHGQVPVEQEPRHHLAFENEFLKILEPQIPAGDTTLEHLHTHDDATVCIHGSQVRAKPPGGEWSNPGAVCAPGAAGLTEYTGKARAHTVQNVGSGEYHLTLVENLHSGEWTNYEPVTAAGLKVVRENRAFRVYDVQTSGDGVQPHSHKVPVVVVVAVSGNVFAGDQRLDRPGQAVFIPAGKEHRVTSTDDARIVEIEVR
jgi:hypothetical protein